MTWQARMPTPQDILFKVSIKTVFSDLGIQYKSNSMIFIFKGQARMPTPQDK